MVRAQILLDAEQDRRLREVAAREGKSISEVIREILDAYFTEQERQKRQEALHALAELDRIRNEIAEQVGVSDADLVNEARQERERQMGDVWKQWS